MPVGEELKNLWNYPLVTALPKSLMKIAAIKIWYM